MSDREMSNSVLISGQQDDVEPAKEESLELYKFVLEERKAREIKPGLVWVSKNSVGGIIGHQGDMIQAIQRETNTTIHLSEDWAPDKATVRLIGGGDGIATAMRRIRGIEAKMGREITTEIRIDPHYYRILIGSGCQSLHSIIVQAGGPLDVKAQARAIRFPHPSDHSDLVKLYGDPKFVRRMEAELERRVAELKHC
ncbi:hypothetical protein RhiJN_17267 [Ceratobasidium sp. AG-Ba]|nr:hypothetical protein RhiJN_17267 [Ceratobasidium sp. AG-Ba]